MCICCIPPLLCPRTTSGPIDLCIYISAEPSSAPLRLITQLSLRGNRNFEDLIAIAWGDFDVCSIPGGRHREDWRREDGDWSVRKERIRSWMRG